MHADEPDQVVDRAFAVANGIEDASPGRLGNHIEDVQSSGHAMKVCDRVYMRKRI